MDENINSEALAIDLRKVPGWRIELHADHLETSDSDVTVVNLCAAKRWGLITIDEMRYTPETKIAIVRGNVRVFKLITHERTHYTHLLGALIVAQPQMQLVMADEKEALCAHIHKSGKLQIATRFEEYRDLAKYSESKLRTLAKYPRLRF